MSDKLDKTFLEGEMVLRSVDAKEDDEKGYMACITFNDERMLGYFFDWWKEVGKEQFEAAIIDL